MYFDKLTIIIVTFHSHAIIEKCLDNLHERYKKIVVENSDDTQFAKKLIKKYKNLECFNISYDAGFSYAANKEIKKST